ncbi:MAG: hypothetical protein AAF871_08240 [Pseudomonadota bacterium]
MRRLKDLLRLARLHRDLDLAVLADAVAQSEQARHAKERASGALDRLRGALEEDPRHALDWPGSGEAALKHGRLRVAQAAASLARAEAELATPFEKARRGVARAEVLEQLLSDLRSTKRRRIK